MRKPHLSTLLVCLGLLVPLGAESAAQAPSARTGTAPVRSAPPAVTEAVAEVFANVENLEDIEVHGSLGEVIGDVHALVVDEEGIHYIVVEVGGFLGFGDRRVAIPMAGVAARGDVSLALVELSGDQIEAMAEWNEDTPGYTIVEPTR